VFPCLADLLCRWQHPHLWARQAAEVPSRRADLIKILDSFSATDDAPGRMSPERLRSALGLD
jgi:hypothetical protein